VTVYEAAPIEIPDIALTPFVLGRAGSFASRPALIDGPTGRSLTFAELEERVRRCAVGLRARGLSPGEVVAIVGPNSPEYVVAFHGVSLAGGTNTTVNPLYTADELALQLRDAHARFLIVAGSVLERGLPAAESAGVEAVFALDDAPGATPLSALLAEDAPAPELELDPADHVVSLPYSSGTTGLPKGVMLTHRNLVANALQVVAARPLLPGDALVCVLPFYHCYGQCVLMNACLREGGTLVTMPRFDLESYLSLTARYRATLAYIAPPIVLALAKSPAVDDHDVTSLRSILSGAAPLDAELAMAAAERIGCEVVQGYGMTEASPVTHMTPIGLEQRRPGSVGPLVPGTDARIVDLLSGEDVEPGEPGELLVRGPQVMKGYLGNEQATRGAFTEGWLRTGDVARVDADGWFWIVDRIKELIKVKGFQVAPAELEALLLTHPAVADACVIGVPDPDAGEIPKGFVVLRGEVTPADLLDYVAARVAPHKRVRELEAIDAIPKSPSGKILRRVLAERELAAREHEGS
jgi:acyl-CoA synthetase (AMP-forming)/AMP-acid ligase II